MPTNLKAKSGGCAVELCFRNSNIRCDVEMVNMADHNFGNEKPHPLTALVMGLYDSLWEDWRPNWQAHHHHSITTCESEGLP